MTSVPPIDGLVFQVLALDERTTLNDLETELSRLPADDLRRATAFAFRVSPDFVQAAGESTRAELRRSVLRRSHEKPIYLICFDRSTADIQAWRLLEEGIIPESAELLPLIRHADLLSTLKAAGSPAFLRASKSYHFIAPSLTHTNSFLRVADVISSRAALDTLAFWCCPQIARAEAVIVDTWSVCSIPLRAMQLAGRQILLDCLPAHPATDRDAAKGVLIGTLESLNWEAQVFFLISVLGDGDGVRTTQMLLAELGYGDLATQWAALYGYANSPDSAAIFCRLQERHDSFSPHTCIWCQEASVAIPVHSRVYHVALGEEQFLALLPSFFEGHRPFIEVYGNIDGILRVHRDDPNDDRHHAFYVDVLTLLAHDTFHAKFLAALDSCQWPPQVVVVPDHHAGQALGRLAADYLGVPLIVHDDLRKKHLDPAYIEILNRVENILLIDDVFKTGSRFDDFVRALREEDYTSFRSVEYLVAVARPAADEILTSKRNALKRHTSWQTSFNWVEKILLPDWGPDDCPWCKEYDALGRLSETLPRPAPWLANRMGRLSELARGLSSNPFLLGPHQEPLPLARQSSVGMSGLSPIGTLFSYAAALQGLRTAADETKRLQPGFPLFRSLAPRVFQNYNEGLLRQCILRLVKPSEWPAKLRTDSLHMLETNLQSDPLVIGEFVLALSRHALMPMLDDRLVDLWRRVFLLEQSALELLLGLEARETQPAATASSAIELKT